MPLNADRRKILSGLIPEGIIVTRKWLIKNGFDPHAIDNLVKSKQLKVLSHGVYSRGEVSNSWQAIVYALQTILNLECVVGGLTALELQGFSQYVSLAEKKVIHLYSTGPLPNWINNISADISFIRQNSKEIIIGDTKAKKNESFTIKRDWKENIPGLIVSAPERAILEVLLDVPDEISFEHANELMQGMTSLSPRTVQKLLEGCKNVKAKRLFLWLAERQNYPWFSKLNLKTIDLGSGNRMLLKGGKLDKKYKITIPESL